MMNESLIDAISCVQEKCCWVTAFTLAGTLATLRSVARAHLKKRKSRRSGRFPIRFTFHTGPTG